MASQATPAADPQPIGKVTILHSCARALGVLNRRYWRGTADHAELATFILNLAMTHPQVVDGWMNQVTHYCEAEGIHPHQYVQHTLERLHPPLKLRTSKKPQTKKGKTP